MWSGVTFDTGAVPTVVDTSEHRERFAQGAARVGHPGETAGVC